MRKIPSWLTRALVTLTLAAVTPATGQAQGCSAASVTLTVGPPAATCPGTVSTTAGWSVTNGAGVLLDFALSTGFAQQNVQIGTSGTWPFATALPGPGTYTLTVSAYPLIVSGGGYQVCSGQGTASSQTFTLTCPLNATLACTWPGCTPFVPPGTVCPGTCTSNVTGGTAPYTLTWQDSVGTSTQTLPTAGAITAPLTCIAPGFVNLTVNDSVGTTFALSVPCP